MMTKVNLNDRVKVKLTEEGIQVLARRHKGLRESVTGNGGQDIGEFVLVLDQEGYYSTQLWILLRDFQGELDWDKPNVFSGNDLFFLGGQTRGVNR